MDGGSRAWQKWPSKAGRGRCSSCFLPRPNSGVFPGESAQRGLLRGLHFGGRRQKLTVSSLFLPSSALPETHVFHPLSGQPSWLVLPIALGPFLGFHRDAPTAPLQGSGINSRKNFQSELWWHRLDLFPAEGSRWILGLLTTQSPTGKSWEHNASCGGWEGSPSS